MAFRCNFRDSSRRRRSFSLFSFEGWGLLFLSLFPSCPFSWQSYFALYLGSVRVYVSLLPSVSSSCVLVISLFLFFFTSPPPTRSPSPDIFFCYSLDCLHFWPGRPFFFRSTAQAHFIFSFIQPLQRERLRFTSVEGEKESWKRLPINEFLFSVRPISFQCCCRFGVFLCIYVFVYLCFSDLFPREIGSIFTRPSYFPGFFFFHLVEFRKVRRVQCFGVCFFLFIVGLVRLRALRQLKEMADARQGSEAAFFCV